MAFRKDKTTAAQTAANVAGVVTAAAINAGGLPVDEAPEYVVAVFEGLFDEMAPVVDADNALFAEVEAADTPAPAKAKGRAGKTSGGNRKSTGSITLDDALSLELTGKGIFAGETLGDVLALSTEQCDSDYGYGDGERSGRDYIAWLASDRNKNTFTQARARVIADSEGISY